MSDMEATESSATSQQLLELKEKIRLIQQIASNSKKDHSLRSKSLRNLLCFFTGTNEQIIEHVLNVLQSKMTFTDWITAKKEIQEAPTVEYKHLRNIIIDQYVNKLKLPFRSNIFTEITALGYFPYTPTISNNDLLKHGFKWKRLPNLTTENNQGGEIKVILVEETEQIFRRLKYFHKMKLYREAERNIIHLEVIDVNRYYKDPIRINTTAVLAASTYDGVIINTKIEDNLDKWLKNTLYAVPENSVFVIEPTDLELGEFCELPTIHSQKSKMMKWLDCYNIPYELTAHRAELFALFQKCKGTCPPKYKCCEYLKAQGHEVIIRPKELSYTKYFDFLLKDLPYFVSMTDNFNENFTDSLSKVTKEDCLKHDRIMAQKEMDIYNDDQKLELLIDKIIETFKYQRLSESVLKTIECETALVDNDFYDSILCKYESQ